MGIDSPREILSKSASDLIKLLRINQAQAEEILNSASNQAFDWRLRERTGYELIVNQQHEQDSEPLPTSLTTGDSAMDKILNQGIPLGTITEVVGERFLFSTQKREK